MGKYIVDLIAVVLAAFIIFRCARKGFFLTILSFFKFLLAVLAAYFFGGKLGALLGSTSKASRARFRLSCGPMR